VLRSFRFAVTTPAAGIQGEVTALGQLVDGVASMLVGR